MDKTECVKEIIKLLEERRGCGQNLGLPWAPKGAEKICFHKKKSIRP